MTCIPAVLQRSRANGQADLTVYDGRDYTFSAIISTSATSARQRCGGWRSFHAAQGVSVDPLTIDRDGGGCR